ncbi:YitT family protein [Virgibacillus sp. NKC19-3]|uniref:YitT family protein n=1 Tax=Virgibacillus saliphilus TaxID=2831674 RepID=UPI001C9B5BBD|nr:YitT family protein [Virgibacillus sp. NKC19-3]MBY7143167.1 YitT family protein [Virgibacillus sp. NKC19-3]
MKQFMIKNGLVVTGGAIQGLGMGLFLFPHSIPSGGAAGIAVMLNYLFGISTGLAMWIVNFSLLLFGVKFFGKRFVIWTIVGITVTSATVHLFEVHGSIPNRNIWYDLFFGSVFLGTGVGMVMRQGVSNGGFGVVALIISSGRNLLPGKPLFYINGSIFLITGFIIDLKIILLALVSQWISTRTIDLICQMDFRRTYTLDWKKKT